MSERKVVISSRRSPLRTPTVPKRTPCSQTPSLQRRTTARIWSGVASVVRSMSGELRSSRASRTVPPTRYSSWPASVKRRPRSRTTLANGAAFSSAPRASRWAGESSDMHRSIRVPPLGQFKWFTYEQPGQPVWGGGGRMPDTNKMSRAEAGRKGGQTTKKRYGDDFFGKIGRMGGKKGGETTKQRYGIEFYQKIGRKGGSR